jgi:glycosyltransferase involved in cell wall biosynthesis
LYWDLYKARSSNIDLPNCADKNDFAQYINSIDAEKFTFRKVRKNNSSKKGLKIVFVSAFPPSRARLSEYGFYFIKELRRLSQIDHIDIIADTVKNFEVKKINSKITLYRIWRMNNPLSFLSILLKVARLKPDIVHFNLHMAVFGRSRVANFFGLLLPYLCRIMGFMSIVTLHNLVERIDLERTGYSNTSFNRIGALIATKLLSSVSAVTLTVSSYLRSFKLRYGCERVFWIPHGTWKVEQINHMSHNPAIILYFGHSGPYKDFDLLFKAFKILKDKGEKVKLIIAGTSHPNHPDFLEKYKIEKPDDVEFIGYVPDNQLYSLFEKTALVVLPYHTCTGTSGVAHLVSSYGVPMVATYLPEFKELVEEGCGIILSPHDPSELAKKIEKVLKNKELAQELGARNLAFAEGRTWDKVAGKFLEIYQDLIG